MIVILIGLRLWGDSIMTELTQEHFELHTKNKAEQFERQKIKFLEDRISSTLEKSAISFKPCQNFGRRYNQYDYEGDNS